MNFFRMIKAIVCILLGLYALGTLVQGLSSGEIARFSKHGHAVIQRNSEPDRFWIQIGFWTIGTVMLIGGGTNMLRKNQ